MASKDYISEWLAESEENKRLYFQEGLLLEASEAIWGAMERKNINRKQLADMLRTSKAHITQLLNGNRNMTLRTFADIAYAIGLHAHVKLCDEDVLNDWHDLEAVIPRSSVSRHFSVTELASNEDEWITLEPAA